MKLQVPQMGCEKPIDQSYDLLSRPLPAFLLYCIPALLIVVTARADVSARTRTIAWTVSLVVLGTACIANSVRCGRMHCYFTGPFFLVMALATVLYDKGLLPIGNNGWNLLGLAILVGAIAFCCIPEVLWGKYRRREPSA